MKKRLTLILVQYVLLLCFMAATPMSARSQTWVPKYVSMTYGSGGFYEYLPVGYNDPANANKRYPVILSIHGIGNLGNGTTDLAGIRNFGVPAAINLGLFPPVFNVGGQEYSFIVIAPQFSNWPENQQVENVLNYIEANYRADASRLYLTGLSMGGGATWEYASSSPTAAKRLAAIYPVCGASSPSTSKAEIMAKADLPVLATHYEGDAIVTVWNTIGYVDGINSFNPRIPAIKVIWPGGGHNAWVPSYDPNEKITGNMSAYEWMLQYSRGSSGPPPPSVLSVNISGSTQVSCFGGMDGTATASAVGGTGPYTYSWSTSPVQTGAMASNLPAGTYTVTARDAVGATATRSVTISQPSQLLLNVTPGTIATFGQTTSVTVSASGGTAPYTFTGPTTNVPAGTHNYTVTDAKGCRDSRTVTIVNPAPTAVVARLVTWKDVNCNGGSDGSATMELVGGVPPFTISWSTNPAQTGLTATNLSPGSYTMTVRDANNTTSTATVNIDQPTKLNLNVSAGSITVNGGSTNVSVSATGGKAPYTFSGPTSNVKAGTYTYTVTDANGCTDTKNITITEPANAVLSIVSVTHTDVSCNGSSNGTAGITVSGGVTPYTYSWNGGPAQSLSTVSGLAAGNHTVVVRDATGKSVNTSITIGQPALLQLTAIAGTISIPGGTTNVTLSASGGTAPYTFSGSTSNLKAGTYTFTVTDARSCNASASITIKDAIPPLKLSGKAPAIKCKGGTSNVSLTAEGGVLPYTYTGDTVSLRAGTYSYSVRDAAGQNASVTLTVTEPEALTISGSASIITTIGGSTNVELKANGGTIPYQFSGNALGVRAGTYNYQVTDANGCTATASVDVKEPMVTLSAFNLQTDDTTIHLQWATSYEFAIDRFEVEKAKDGKTFFTVIRDKAKGNGTGNREYMQPDIQQLGGSNTYKLFAVTSFGEKVFLGEKKFYFDTKGSISVKNLVNRIDITVISSREERVSVMVFDILGRPVIQRDIQKNSSAIRTTLPMDNLNRGLYVVKVFTQSGMQSVKQVVKP